MTELVLKLLGRRQVASISAGRAAAAIISSLLLIVSIACAGGKNATKQSQVRDQAVPVTVANIVRKDVPVQVQAIGNVEPYNTVSVKSMVPGEIVEVGFSEGQDVRKGEVLFVIDQRPYEAALAQAQGTLAKDRATAANAKAEAARWEALFKEGVVSREQHDQMITAAQAAQETVTADEATVQNARVNLTYCSIRSPINGRTGNLAVKIGNVVKANDVPLVTINQIEPIYVTFSVPQQFLPEISRREREQKLPVVAKVQNQPQATGLLTFIDNTVDPQTGTIKLKGTFNNNDRHLWPGQFADVSLTLGIDHNAMVVPSAAVQTGQDGQYMFVVRNGKAEMKKVSVVRTAGAETVIQPGQGEALQAGDQVVTDGQLRLTPGAKVAVSNQSSATSQAASSSGAAGHQAAGL